MLRPRRQGWCGVKSGVELAGSGVRRDAKLAGPGVRRGVQCGGARRRSKSRYSAAIRQKLVGVTEGWPLVHWTPPIKRTPLCEAGFEVEEQTGQDFMPRAGYPTLHSQPVSISQLRK